MLTRGAVARSPHHQWAEHRHQSAFGLPSFGWYIIIAPNFRSDRYPLVLMRVAIREKRACNECASDKTNHSRQKCIFQFGSIQSSGRCHVHEQLTQSRSLAWDAAWSVTQHWWTIYAMICYNIMLDNFRGITTMDELLPMHVSIFETLHHGHFHAIISVLVICIQWRFVL